MLAGIEDQENSLVPQIGHQAGRRVIRLNGQSQHRGHRYGGELGIAQHAKVDEERGAVKGLDQPMCIGEGVAQTMKLVADNVQTVIIPAPCGHWVAEEAPEKLLAALTPFLAPYKVAAR